ncbi:RICIN domain-containing protein [Streptomyces sp. NPDC088258]|uniref:RICIN domain-containing protein n=1 Tax=Streptomyces sp. NPDC088258 TaxID=3365849 RepID=UPI0038239B8C
MRGAAADPGGALAPGGALTPGGGRPGRTNTSSTAATRDAAVGPVSPASKGPDSDGPENKGPEKKDPENKTPDSKTPDSKDAPKKATERTSADETTAAARGTSTAIGAPKASASAPAVGTKAADRAATKAAAEAAAKDKAASAPSASSTPNSPATSTVVASSASAASVASPASSASPSAPTAVLATVSTAGAAPDAAVALAAAGSGGAGANTHAGDEPPGSRPKKPMLAAAAIVGAILIAVPFLVAGQDDREPERTRTQNAAGTVLDTERSAVPDTYTSESPTPSVKPSKEVKEKEKEKPVVPQVQQQTLAPSPSASETTEPDKPKKEKKVKVKELTAAEKLRQWANGRSGVQNTVIKNAATGQCVDIGGYGKGKPTEPVNQYPCNNTTADNQLWNLDIVDKDGGPQNAPLFLIRNSKDGFCLDVGYYNARPAGSKVSEFHCNAVGDNQLWWLDPRGDGTNWIRNAVSNDLCLRPTGGDNAGNDARLEIAECGFGDRWIV